MIIENERYNNMKEVINQMRENLKVIQEIVKIILDELEKIYVMFVLIMMVKNIFGIIFNNFY